MSLLDTINTVKINNVNLGNAVDMNNKFTAEMWFYVPTRILTTAEILTPQLNPPHIIFEMVSAEDNSSLISIAVKYNAIPYFTIVCSPTFTDIIPIFSYDTWYHIVIAGGTMNFDGNIGYPMSSCYYFNGIQNSVQRFSLTTAAKFNNVNITLYPHAHIYNFKLIKDWIYGDPTNVNTIQPTVILPSNFNDYLLVLYTAIKDIVIAGGVLVPGALIPKIVGSAVSSTVLSNLNTSNLVPPGALIPHATICFKEDTPVLTDNYGYVFIKDLIPGTHTIGGMEILAVTKSITPDSKLVCISTDALEKGIPSADTIISAHHKILVNGEMTKAIKLVPEQAQLVDYCQEILYNVVLSCNSTMTVNNMTVETLDPENLVAKMVVAMKGMNQEQRETSVLIYNEYIKHLILSRHN